MAPRLVGRLTAPVTALALLLLISAIGSAWYVRSLQRSTSELLASNVTSMQAAQELEISLREVRTQFTRYLLSEDQGHLKPIPQLKQRTEEALAAAERTAFTQEEQELMQRVRAGHTRIFDEYDKVLREERKQWVYSKIFQLTDEVFENEILEPARQYLRLNEEGLTTTTAANQRTADQLTIGLIILGVCGSAGGVLAGTLITAAVRRSMLRTEEEVRSTTAQLGRAIHLPPDTDDGALTDPIEQMKSSASAVISRLRQTERDALRAEQLAWVGQMAAGIAHEVRNPLMAIKLLVQATVERRGHGGFKPRDLQVLEEEIVRLEHIVSGFLDFARPPRPNPQPVDVADLARRVLDGVQARAELQGVRLSVESTGPAVVSADPNQVRQILFNLTFNALDAQPQGGHVIVRVGAAEAAETGDELVVEVEDGGPGLPPKLGERVFDPFVSTKETGLGLGLSICKRIAESHGGRLSATSTDSGAVFVLRLPTASIPQPEDATCPLY